MTETPFIKFPSTPYLLSSSAVSKREDKILSDAEAHIFFTESVTVEEKIDGANLGISFTSDGTIQLQSRGHLLLEPYSGQWTPLSDWIHRRTEDLFDSLLDRFILFGEWCYLTHSVFYNSLPDFFIAFDVFDKQCNRFLSVKKRNLLITQIGLTPVPLIFTGHIKREALVHMIGKSAFGDELCEGLYFRIDSGDYLLRRAKYVRSGFSQSIETHWSKNSSRKNQIRW